MNFFNQQTYQWHCKKRIQNNDLQQILLRHDASSNAGETVAMLTMLEVILLNDLNNEHCRHSYQCYCGRYLESLRGLNNHCKSC